MSNYKELVVWQKAIQLVTDIYKLTKTFPKEEKLYVGMKLSINHFQHFLVKSAIRGQKTVF